MDSEYTLYNIFAINPFKNVAKTQYSASIFINCLSNN